MKSHSENMKMQVIDFSYNGSYFQGRDTETQRNPFYFSTGVLSLSLCSGFGIFSLLLSRQKNLQRASLTSGFGF
jgi:hypothetical protein